MKAAQGLLSWGNHPPFAQKPEACHWPQEVAAKVLALRDRHGSTLPFGAGLSYGDSCLASSDQVLHTVAMDRFLAADWQAGVLRAQCGITLSEILAQAIPRGWFLPVSPGTKMVTLGGAVANDVHGKNHHRRGTLGCHVRSLGLWRSDAGLMICSPTEHSELFAATIGGMGLTGVILWVELQLVPIASSEILCRSQRFENLDEFFALSRQHDAQHEFCVSWIDCLASGSRLGRGVYLAGDFAPQGRLAVASARSIAVPFTPPVSVINAVSLRLFNEVYWRRAPARSTVRQMGYDPFFYPLDGVRHWNRLYGPRGFQQYQALIPEASARDGIAALLKAIAASGCGSFLAVLKRCGDLRSPGLMSFPGPGTTLALDFPNAVGLPMLFGRLDAMVREVGGRLYPAKDAHMSAEDFQGAYPQWVQLQALRDPALRSRFWDRVTS